MVNKLLLLTATFAGLTLATPAFFISVDGPITSNFGLGLANDPYQAANGIQFQLNTAASISFLANLSSLPNSTLTYWITDQLGPGTTNADVIATGTATTNDGGLLTVFEDVALAPGTYYLTLSLLGQPNIAGWNFASDAKVTSTGVISYLGSYFTGGTNPSGGFAPSFDGYFQIGNSMGFLFEMDGIATPEPSTACLGMLGLLALGAAKWQIHRSRVSR